MADIIKAIHVIAVGRDQNIGIAWDAVKAICSPLCEDLAYAGDKIQVLPVVCTENLSPDIVVMKAAKD